MTLSIRRVWGVIVRHMFNFRHSWDRITDAFYWPSIDIIVWGLAIAAMQRQGVSTTSHIAMILIGVVLWYVVWRSQYEITVNLLDELWSENLGNLFATPLTLAEWTVGLLALGFLKLFLTVAFTSAIAYFLYAVNIFMLGPALMPFIVSLLVMGWWFGLLVAALFLRYGTTIQTLAWAGGFALMPFSAAYYPMSSMPVWMQMVAKFIPSSYVFEGMRIVLATGRMPTGMIVESFVLNAVYFILALAIFIRSFRQAKVRGLSHIR